MVPSRTGDSAENGFAVDASLPSRASETAEARLLVPHTDSVARSALALFGAARAVIGQTKRLLEEFLRTAGRVGEGDELALLLLRRLVRGVLDAADDALLERGRQADELLHLERESGERPASPLSDEVVRSAHALFGAARELFAQTKHLLEESLRSTECEGTEQEMPTLFLQRLLNGMLEAAQILLQDEGVGEAQEPLTADRAKGGVEEVKPLPADRAKGAGEAKEPMSADRAKAGDQEVKPLPADRSEAEVEAQARLSAEPVQQPFAQAAGAGSPPALPMG